MIDLDAIKARCAGAMPGDWTRDDPDAQPWEIGRSGGMCVGWNPVVVVLEGAFREGNAAFIEHARQDVPALVAEVEQLEARCERLKALALSMGEDVVTLRATLEKYGRHQFGCPLYGGVPTEAQKARGCNCGFDAAARGRGSR